MSLFLIVFTFIRALFKNKSELAAENLALRQQLDTAPKYVLRDNDKIYGEVFRRRVESMHIEEVRISPRSPWQNPFAERVIGSIRRECLHHMIILGERHLRPWRVCPLLQRVALPPVA